MVGIAFLLSLAFFAEKGGAGSLSWLVTTRVVRRMDRREYLVSLHLGTFPLELAVRPFG
jgi:hypothetical protein